MSELKIVGIGGAASLHSSTEQALRLALDAAAQDGATVRLFGGATLARLPHYLLHGAELPFEACEMLAAVRDADGIILASPGYHGTVSGLFKNAIDYLEETARDPRVYLDGLPVGLIATAYGWQATGSTMAAMRSIAHALRGWPTPLGAALNTSGGVFRDGLCHDGKIAAQLALVGQQVVSFARLRRSGAIDPALSATA